MPSAIFFFFNHPGPCNQSFSSFYYCPMGTMAPLCCVHGENQVKEADVGKLVQLMTQS